MSLSTEVARLDGTGQAQLIERKEVTPLELVEAAIERIARLNPKVNAVVHTLFDQARAAAQDPSALPRGPFRGVPYLLKNLVASYAGAPLTSGSAFLRRYIPNFDSVIVSRLKRSGMIILGKTNTPEFGLLPTTEPRLYGPTRNPWRLDRTAGGSSGGSAAAVAARMVPMAHANDGGGSIRMPASCCGVFGLKPTRGRISLGPSAGEGMGGLVIEHAVTLSVRDSASLLDATAGPSPGDPYWATPPERGFLEAVGRDPGKLRIAYSTSSLIGTPVHPDCVRAACESAKLCSELGHELVEAAPTLDGQQLMEAFMTVWAGGSAAGIDAAAALMGQAPAENQFEPATWSLYQLGRCVTASQYIHAMDALHGVTRAVAHFMERYDVWLTPVLGSPPEPLGWLNGPPLEAQERTAAFAAFTPLANATGQPAMSVPLYWNGEGLPIGSHFAGRYGEEGLLFQLAAQLEAARPWAHRFPATSALSEVA